ncbi:MAG: hypothetical protein GX868_17575 [Actinobacteria bacterium]|nr:hypothetical protein [Actinomycetota bacterium]
MLDYVVIAVVLGVFVTALAARRRGRAAKNGRARTVSIDVTGDGVSRALGDGRIERATWAQLTLVEVICTPVKTADGATSFMLLGESSDAGCLVPLGVGLESRVLVELTRLPGFRLERLTDAQSHKAPHRETVWERPAGSA